MIAALLYSGIPAVFLGRKKKPLAQDLHDKVLFADAKMNQADWLTAAAALVGVVGIGFGIWWADSVAAIVISLDILHDGQRYMRASVADLMDERPVRHDESAPHPLIDDVKEKLASRTWIEEGAVRLREEGHLITGTVWVVPEDDERLVDRVERLRAELEGMDWRLHDIVVSPVRAIQNAPEGIRVKPGQGR